MQRNSAAVHGSLFGRFGMCAALALLCALAGLGLAPASAQAISTDLAAASIGAQAAGGAYSWYEGKESPYQINTVAQLKEFAELVNSGRDDFQGKEVQLTAQLAFLTGSIEPIGTADHPFQGTFDGGRGSATGEGIVGMVNEPCILNLTVDVGNRLQYVGLFGYCGEQAIIRNLTVYGGEENPLVVTNKQDGKTISYVGAIAGYLGGSIQNCYSSVEISVTNDGKVPEKEGKTASELCTILYVGGIVGSVGGDVVDCAHADAALRITSKSDVSSNVPYIAGYVGGIAGMQGDDQDASKVTRTSGCSNTGSLVFQVNGKGGLDRFQEQMYSCSTMVGGIVGYAMGNVSDCANMAELQTGIIGPNVKTGAMELKAGWGATATGGIVGSLRGPTLVSSTSATGVVGSSESDPGYDVWTKSGGTQEAGRISIERCINTAHVVGLTSVGGICGSAGAFTEIAGCVNNGQVDGTRWNKPCPAGIVGITNGDVAYCANTGRIATTTGSGFYASGVAGLLTTYNSSKTEAKLLLPATEMYGCYVTGMIVSTDDGGYRSAVLAGENDGYIHDNCFLPNLTPDKVVNEEVFGDKKSHSALVFGDESLGTLANNHELEAADLRSSKGISLLNRANAFNGTWRYSYVPNPDGGYPLLAWQLKGEIQPEAALDDVVNPDSVTLVADPSYSAATTPIPEVTIETADGRALYQNADFKVVPQSDARAVSDEKVYRAKIVGMNAYEGELSQEVAYGIRKCDIDTCLVLAGSQVFNWEPQDPAWIKVLDDAGNAIPPENYTWEKVGFDPDNVKADSDKKYHDYTNVHTPTYRYDIKVTATDDSECYTGSTTQAVFHIEWALLMLDKDESGTSTTNPGCKFDKVVWDGQEWDFAEATETKGLIKIKYTGNPIKPTVNRITYLDQPLRDGTQAAYWKAPLDYDFRYVYGNPNAVDVDAESTDCVNATGTDETSLACMTVRFTTGGNFNNYSNVFFEITPASIEDDVAIANIKSSYAYAGSPVKVAPVLTYNGKTLKQGVDYKLSYKSNNQSGKASVTITGVGNYEGSVTRSFTITKGAQAIKASSKAKTIKAAKLAKKAQTVNIAKLCKAKAKTAVSYTGKANKKKSCFKVSKKGMLSVKKGTPKGTYKVTVTAKAGADARYKAAKAKKFAITVKVK